MTDWKTAQGPWSFTPQVNKLWYNEGSHISSFEDPTFNADDPIGIPITPRHDPCGYWYKDPSFITPPTFTTEIVAHGGLSIMWTPDLGSDEFGRWVTGDTGSSSVSSIYYSDDGGYNWVYIQNPGGLYQHFFTLLQVGSYYYGITILGIVRSTDCINWIKVCDYIADWDSHYAKSFSYNQLLGKFVVALSSGYIYTSNDLCETWVYSDRVGIYTNRFGNVYYQGKTYLFASYSGLYSHDLANWINLDLSSYTSAVSAQNAFVGGPVLLYSDLYTRDAITWTSHGKNLTRFGYNATLGAFVAVSNDGYPNRVYISQYGDGWIEEELAYSGKIKYGCAMSTDRYIVVGQYPYCLIGIKDD